MPIQVIKPTNAEMLRCVARASDVAGTWDGFPDSDMPGCRRQLFNYVGFAAPEGGINPVGDTAKPAIRHLRPGFGVAFVKAEPGQGVPFHAHDTNETFMGLGGTYRVEWEGAEGVGSVLIGKYDLISFPPGVQRRFECVEAEPGGTTATLLGVVGGDEPKAEYSPEAAAWLRAAGKLPAPEAVEA
jgi:quercetin dioxygenase-like cupin family protein